MRYSIQISLILNQVQRTSNHHSPVEENKCVKKYNSHWRLSSTDPVVFFFIIWEHAWYIIINLVQSLLEEVKEKEYFVADKMKIIFEKNLEVSDCKLVRQPEYEGRPPGGYY